MFGTSFQITDFSLCILESQIVTQTKSEVCGRVITDSLTESLTDFLTDFRLVRESEKRPRTCVGQMLIPARACQKLVLTRTRDA
jgi:hypothetical protein